MLGLALGATVLSAVLFGLAPALRLARTTAGEALKEGSRTIAGSAQQRTRRALAAAEVALAFVLVVSSGLLLRSFVSMVTRDPGFQPPRRDDRLHRAADGPLRRRRRPASSSAARPSACARSRACARRPSAPTCRGRATTRTRASTSSGRTSAKDEGPEARYHFITAGYLRATGTPLLAGRDLGGVGRRRRAAGRPDERGGRAQVLDDAGGRGRRAREPVGQGADGGRRDRRRPGHALARAQPCPRSTSRSPRRGTRSGCS